AALEEAYRTRIEKINGRQQARHNRGLGPDSVLTARRNVLDAAKQRIDKDRAVRARKEFSQQARKDAARAWKARLKYEQAAKKADARANWANVTSAALRATGREA